MATERGHFVCAVPTSQKTWRKHQVLLSGDWESPSGHPVRFHIPTTFQIAGRPSYRSPSATQAEIRQIERVRLKVPAVERIYPKFLFTPNLIKAQFVNPAEMTEERRAAEAKRMNESSRRRLMLDIQGKKKKGRQPKTVPTSSGGVDPKDLTFNERRRQMNAESAHAGATTAGLSPSRGVPTEGTSIKATSKRPFTVDLEADPSPKREPALAIFVAEDDEAPVEPVTLACPSKTVQFVNHMILGSQMELSEIEDLPKKLLREEAGRAFRLQASRAINAAEKAKKAYEDGRTRLAAKEALESKEAIQVAFEESERARALEIEAAVQEAIRGYRQSSEFTTLLDKEVGSEMADLLYRFKQYNPGKKLNLNFIADPPPFPEGMTEEMIEDYEGEDAPEEAPADAEEDTAEGEEAVA
ncbi:unnamed protein product [Prunus armeniaca]